MLVINFIIDFKGFLHSYYVDIFVDKMLLTKNLVQQ
jgi:hypothetical protein